MKLLEEAIELQKKYKEIYKNDWFVSVSYDGINVTYDYFIDKFDNYEVRKRELGKYPLKLIKEKDNVKIFTLVPMDKALNNHKEKFEVLFANEGGKK